MSGLSLVETSMLTAKFEKSSFNGFVKVVHWSDWEIDRSAEGTQTQVYNGTVSLPFAPFT